MPVTMPVTRRLLGYVAASIAVLPNAAFALGLGPIEVQSALDEPLSARIPIVSLRPGEIESLTAGLAPAELFERLGFERPVLLNQLNFTVENRGGDAPYIQVTSRNPIREPLLDLLLEVRWSSGRLLRDYAVLLDPPTMVRRNRPANPVAPYVADSGAKAAEIAATSVPPARKAVPTTSRRVVRTTPGPVTGTVRTAAGSSADSGQVASASAPAGGNFSGSSYGPVGPGETLWSIASATRPDRAVSVQQMMLALLRANPQAFFRPNVNSLNEGAVLRVPGRDEVVSMSKNAALREVEAQYEMPRTLPRNVATGVPDQEQPMSLRLTKPGVSSVLPTEEQIAETSGQDVGTDSGVEQGGDYRPALIRVENGGISLKLAGMDSLLNSIPTVVAVDDVVLAAEQVDRIVSEQLAATENESARVSVPPTLAEPPVEAVANVEAMAAESMAPEAETPEAVTFADDLDSQRSVWIEAETEPAVPNLAIVETDPGVVAGTDTAADRQAELSGTGAGIEDTDATAGAGNPGVDMNAAFNQDVVPAGVDQETTAVDDMATAGENVPVAADDGSAVLSADSSAGMAPAIDEARPASIPAASEVDLAALAGPGWMQKTLALLNDPRSLAMVGGGALLFLIVVLLLLRRMMSKRGDATPASAQFTADRARPELPELPAVAPAVAAIAADSNIAATDDDEAAAVPAAASQSPAADIDIAAQADVLLAMGDYDDATRLLQQALIEQGEQPELVFKLLEALHGQVDAGAYVSTAEQYRASLEADGTWEQVRQMGVQLDSGSVLFAASAVAETVPAQPATVDSASEPPKLPPEPAVSSAAEVQVAVSSKMDDDVLEFVLPEKPAVSAGQPPAESVAEADPGLDFDLDALAPEGTARIPEPVAARGDEDISLALDEEFRKLEDRAGEHTGPGAEDSESIDLGELEEMLEVDPVAAEVLDFRGTDGGEPAAAETREDGDSFVDTKLDLATAYLEMGDQTGARTLYQEVVEEGNDAQRRQARDGLAQIGYG